MVIRYQKCPVYNMYMFIIYFYSEYGRTALIQIHEKRENLVLNHADI